MMCSISNFDHENFNTKSCRICVKNEGVVSIYWQESDELSMADQIMNISNVFITLDDGLPATICINCAERVHNGYKIKMQCEASSEFFKKMLKNEPALVIKESIKLNKKEHNKKDQFCSIYLTETQSRTQEEFIENKFSDKINIKKSKITNKESLEIVNYECNECNSLFTDNASLLKHKRSHIKDAKLKRIQSIDKVFTCEICSAQYKKNKQLKIHKLKHEPPKCECDECGKLFSNNVLLSRHKKRHQGIRLNCSKCDKTFSSKNTLESHQQSIHLGVKKHQCVVCGKEFFSSSNYKRHIRSHTGEKPYKCESCEKSFADFEFLKIHTNTHTGERPYKCDICNKFVSNKATLKTHSYIHTGEKPFECHVCNDFFRTRQQRQLHLEKHSNIKTVKNYKCHICNKILSKPYTLKNHLKLHVI